MTLLSICIPVWRDVDLLERLLKSIKEKTDGDYEIIISESETPQLYTTIHNHTIISTPPQGHNIAVDVGLKLAKGDYLMWVDVDVVVSKDWWSKMRKIFEDDERIGVVSPLGYPRWDQYVLTVHALPKHLLDLDMIDSPGMQRIMDSREPEYFDLPINIPNCMRYYGFGPEALTMWDYGFEGFSVMRRKCYEELTPEKKGLYAENPSGGNEVNISRNARKKGWRIIAANKVHYYHCDSYPECIGFGRAFRRRGGRKEVV